MIIAAAIKKDNMVYTGKRHHLIMHQPSLPKGYLRDGEQGFITDTGRFVDRIEAAKIALECGQINELKYPPNLFSEEIISLTQDDINGWNNMCQKEDNTMGKSLKSRVDDCVMGIGEDPESIQVVNRILDENASKFENQEIEINLMCSCRCAIMYLKRDEDGDVYISIYEDMFRHKQEGLGRAIWHRIKNAFRMLRGKEYYLYDLHIRPENRQKVLGELIETLQKMR